MNILVTGGCGFVGVNLISYLEEMTSHKIVVLDNLVSGKKEYIADFDVEFVEGDVRDMDVVEKLVKEADAVVHLAADTRVIESIENPLYNFDVNVRGTYNLLSAARDADVEHFVLASTGGAIMGDVEPPVHEDMVPKPISPYGASKLCCEAYCSAFAGSYGMKTVSLRFSNVYGPHSYHKGSVVAEFFRRILKKEPLVIYGDGKQTRDFVFSSDLCAAILRALEVEKGGEVYQLGAGVQTSIENLIFHMRQTVGGDFVFDVIYKDVRKGEIKFNYTRIEKARCFLNYMPKVTLKEGLARTWNWFQNAHVSTI